MFFIDTGAEGNRQKTEVSAPKVDSGCAWIDEDEQETRISLQRGRPKMNLRASSSENIIDGTEYVNRARQHYESRHPRPSWAKRPREDEQDQSSSLGTSLLRKRSSQRAPILPGIIGLRRFRNGNISKPSSKSIVDMDFHPLKPWILVAERGSSLSVFEIDGKENKCIFTLKLPALNILTARFTTNGKEVLITDKSPELMIWNLAEGTVSRSQATRDHSKNGWHKCKASPCGRFVALLNDTNSVTILSAVTHLLIKTIKANAIVNCVDFDPSGKFLFTAGADNAIYVWSTSNFQCDSIIKDDGGTSCSSLAISGDGALLSIGSNLGVINIYDLQEIIRKQGMVVKPLKTLTNLTTAINSMVFHPSNELLIFSSSTKRNAIRIMHVQSGTIFSNWPREQTPASRVNVTCFDPSGRLMLIGNEKGHILVYGIKHYYSLADDSGIVE